MGKLGKLWPPILLVVCGWLAYQGWANSRVPHPVDLQAEAIACDELDACGGDEANWSELDASPFVRTYRIDSGSGPVTIECRWSNILFGAVTCLADREDIADLVKETPDQRPHELRRGNSNR
ncbi:MAG: hypothetical protein KUG77_20635 [Nannocystaceae bacterium]|nr:hypothetical protein [Nannocystaceae bacterium]